VIRADGGVDGNVDPASSIVRTKLRDKDLTRRDRIARAVFLVAALVPAAMLLFLAAEMVREAIPAFIYSGWGFFTGLR
jgi:ABC-type phosphate transport system permease subunit